MSAHLLPVSPEWLAKLPDGVALADPDRGYLGRTAVDVGETWAMRAGAFLDLTDTVTAAVVAVKIVLPKVQDGTGWLDQNGATTAELVAFEAACDMAPMTPEQIEALTRLARAAMEVA